MTLGRPLALGVLTIGLTLALTTHFVSWGGEKDTIEDCFDGFQQEHCMRLESEVAYRMWVAGFIFDIQDGDNGQSIGGDIAVDWDSSAYDTLRGIDEIRAGGALQLAGLILAAGSLLVLAYQYLTRDSDIIRYASGAGLAIASVLLLAGLATFAAGVDTMASEFEKTNNGSPPADRFYPTLSDFNWGPGFYLGIAALALTIAATALTLTSHRIDTAIQQATTADQPATSRGRRKSRSTA